MPSTNTSSASARKSAPSAIHHHHASTITALAIVEPIELAGLTDAEVMREEVEALCSHMLWLRNWWRAHEEGIRAADSRTAACAHDHFIDGAMFARGIARAAGFDMNEQRMRDYSWGRNTQNMRIVVGGAV